MAIYCVMNPLSNTTQCMQCNSTQCIILYTTCMTIHTLVLHKGVLFIYIYICVLILFSKNFACVKQMTNMSYAPLLLRMYYLAQSQLKEGRQSFWIDQLIYRNYLFLSLESRSSSAFLCWQTVPARFQYWILEILNRV